jgi:hypothetical protein
MYKEHPDTHVMSCLGRSYEPVGREHALSSVTYQPDTYVLIPGMAKD